MTNYLTQQVTGPVISPFISKDKGDFSNRANCAGAQLKNYAQTLVQDVVVLGGIGAAGREALKGGKFSRAMLKITDTSLNIAKKIAKKIGLNSGSGSGSLPAKFKVLAPIVAVGGLALSYVTGKYIYKMGQIDQKYTDKATLEKNQKHALMH